MPLSFARRKTMPLFDVGIEGKLRRDRIEAVSGEEARDLVLKRIKNDFNGGIKLERVWFQPSSDSSAEST
jgi:hypothetical protein